MPKSAANGFALIAAIFLLVVLGALAYYLVSLNATQQFTSMWSVQGSRALYAARAGVQWGAWQAVNGGGACNGTLAVDAGGGSTFSVAVSCSASPFDELGVTTTVWTITATAAQGSLGDPGYVQRTLQSTISDP